MYFTTDKYISRHTELEKEEYIEFFSKRVETLKGILENTELKDKAISELTKKLGTQSKDFVQAVTVEQLCHYIRGIGLSTNNEIYHFVGYITALEDLINEI